MDLLIAQTSSDVGAGIGVTIMVLLIFAVSVAIFVFQVLCIVDTTKYPDSAWAATGWPGCSTPPTAMGSTWSAR